MKNIKNSQWKILHLEHIHLVEEPWQYFTKRWLQCYWVAQRNNEAYYYDI